jgi:hypothetical protein
MIQYLENTTEFDFGMNSLGSIHFHEYYWDTEHFQITYFDARILKNLTVKTIYLAY